MKDSSISNYILRAIELAEKGRGFVNPNPLVGAIIVKDGKILGEGYHTSYGKMHAEREALADAERRGNSCKGADLFVTLEPCCHTGRQPPCTQAIIEAGIRRVFCGSNDPNPLVSGKGFEILRKAGIEVFTGCCKEACDRINSVFFHYITTKTPYITMKYAVTADGLTACCTGDSKWISCEQSRKRVHFERFWNMAVMTGIKTVLSDNPLLTCRLEAADFELAGIDENAVCEKKLRQPVRIVCDSNLSIPLDCSLVKTAGEIPLIVACAIKDSSLEKNEKACTLRQKGVKVLSVPDERGRVDLAVLAKILGQDGIDSILLESGGELNASALRAGIVNKIQVFVAPKIVGAAASCGTSDGNAWKTYSPVRSCLAEHPAQAVMLSTPEVSLSGTDVLLEYEVKR